MTCRRASEQTPDADGKVSKTDNFRHNVDENVLALGHTRGAYGMNRTFKAAVAALVLVVGFAGPAAAGQVEDGGLRILRASAEQGDAEVQYVLGLKYKAGEDVPQDYAIAVSWFRKASERGYAAAEYELGEMYYGGQRDGSQAAVDRSTIAGVVQSAAIAPPPSSAGSEVRCP
jgi:TPR repeat protein